MPELERFLSEQQELSIPDKEQLLPVSKSVIIKMCNLLAVDQRFSEEIAIASLQFEALLEQDYVDLEIDEETPSLIFALGLSPEGLSPVLLVPPDYVKQVRSNPAWQLGIVVYNASFTVDLFNKKVVNGLSRMEAIYRARAREVEVLLTMKRLGVFEKFELQWNETQMSLLRQFPQGLKSLPEQITQLRRQAMAPFN